MKRTRTPRSDNAPTHRRRGVPHLALLLLALAEAGVVIFLTWPARHTVLCEQLPELAALALVAAVLLVASIRALGPATEDRRLAGGAAIAAGLALFVSAHYLAVWHKPCQDVQKMLHTRYR